MTTVQIDAATSSGFFWTPRLLVTTDESTHYAFSPTQGIGYYKSTDAGATWPTFKTYFTDTPAGGAATDRDHLDIWYEKWEDDANDNVVHIVYFDRDNGEVRYRSLDLDDDTLSSAVTIFSPSSGPDGDTGDSVTICRAASGDLYVTGFVGTQAFFYKSTDSGANWSSVSATMVEARLDRGLLFPDLSSADPADVIMLHYDSSDDDFEVKQFDDSATSVSTTVIDATWNNRTGLVMPVMCGALRQSDGHIITAGWDNWDGREGSATLRAFDINGSSITELTNVRTNGYAQAFITAITIDQANDDIYLLFPEDTDENDADERELYYTKSGDNGTTWDTPTRVGTDDGGISPVLADPGSSGTLLFLPVWQLGQLSCEPDDAVELGVQPGIVQIDVAAGGDDDKLEEAAGTILLDVTPLKSSNEIADSSYLADWRDDADNRLSVLYNADGEFVLERKASGSGASIEFLEAIVTNSPVYVAFRWNATKIGLYLWDGSAWETAEIANTDIPTLSAAKVDIGSQNQSNGFDGIYDNVLFFDDWLTDEEVEYYQALDRHPEPGEQSDFSPGEHYRQFALTEKGLVDRVTSVRFPSRNGTRIRRSES